MSSPIEITNLALSRLGAAPVASFNDADAIQYSLQQVYDKCRKFLLRQNYWNFAIKRQRLLRSALPPEFEYKNKFALPSDFLRLVFVYNNKYYKLERGFILTDANEVYLKYVFDNTDTYTYTEDFIECLSNKIALDISYSVTRDVQVMRSIAPIFEDSLIRAKAADSSEDPTDRLINNSRLLSRRATGG